MACGCQNSCGCIILGDGTTASVVQMGDTFTVSSIPVVSGVADTNCLNLSIAAGIISGVITLSPTDTGIDLICGANGLRAELEIDPAGTAPVSIGPDGLKVDCCAATPPAINDTATVDLDVTAGILTANVKPNLNAGLENQGGGVSIKLQDDPAAIAAPCENRLRFVNGTGDLTFLPDGVDINVVAAGSQVSIAATAGNFGGTSYSQTFTNNGNCGVFLRLFGVGFMEVTTTAGATKDISQNMILDISAVAGGAVDIGGDGLHAFSDYVAGAGAAPPAGEILRWRSHLEKIAFVPAGGSVTFRSRSSALRTIAGYTSTPGAGTFYQFSNIKLAIMPIRIGGFSVA